MADISNIGSQADQQDQSASVTIYQPDGEPYTHGDGQPVTISVLGAYSKKVKRVREAQTKRLLSQRRTKLEPADILDNRVEVAVAAITGWEGWESGGQPLACTPENADALLRQAPWILEQVEQAIEGHARFFAKC